MQALRGDIADERAFVQRVEEVQRPEGYRLVGAFEEGEASACAVAGFRTCHSLAWGRYLYVDDLSTLPGSAGEDMRASCSTGCSPRRGGWAATRSISTPVWASIVPMPTVSI
jgi:hypothetical protein